jgi:hypothetical protein
MIAVFEILRPEADGLTESCGSLGPPLLPGERFSSLRPEWICGIGRLRDDAAEQGLAGRDLVQECGIAAPEDVGPCEIVVGLLTLRMVGQEAGPLEQDGCVERPGRDGLIERGLGLRPTLSIHPGPGAGGGIRPKRMGSSD